MRSAKWVVVANSSQARIFSHDGLKGLKEIQTFVHPVSRLRKEEICSDRCGCANDGINKSHSSWEPEVPLKKRERSMFAKQLAEYLDSARLRGEFTHLYLAASPAFLGDVRAEMNSDLTKCLEEEVGKDITHKTTKEISSFFKYGF